MGADPQYPWTEPVVKGNRKDISRDMIENYFLGMSKLSKLKSGCVVKAVIINGDLTAFGREDELDTFKRLLEDAKKELNVPVFLALGNHDYANNVNDCDNNDCSTRMVKFMVADLSRKMALIKSKDMHVVKIMERPLAYSIGRRCSDPTFRILFNGSLAYSFDIENIHFVQLQNYPTYQIEWQSKLYSEDKEAFCRFKGMQTFNIRSSLNWLENDLRDAAAQAKHIIICFHDSTEHFALDAGAQRFKRLITEYHVAGIFVGHFHNRHGLFPQDSQRYGNVPVFASGAAIYGTFLRVMFYPRTETMSVQGYLSTFSGQAWKLDIKNDTDRFRLRT
uniref:Calcineurin-like phosphoesterase domain-containing protein n=1 Tax=Romanomermis culicivorax TaxID=13658 RepID=A0A915KQ21_ROMCU